MVELTEGSHGQSIFAKLNRFTTRVDGNRVSDYDDDDIAWVGSSQTYYPLSNQKVNHRTHKRSPLAKGPVAATIEGGFSSLRSLPVADELNQIVYTSKEEAMKHSKEKCAYHAQMIRNTNSFKNSDRTETELLDSLHTTEECLAYQQQYLECTVGHDGKGAIIHIYQTDTQEESKRRWTEAAKHVRTVVEDNSRSLNCIWHDEEEGGFLLHIGGCSTAHCNFVYWILKWPRRFYFSNN